VTADCWGYPGRYWPRCDADGWADELFLYIGDRCPNGAKGECMGNDYREWTDAEQRAQGAQAERERNASLICMVADCPDDFRRLIRDIGTAGALRSLAEMIRGGDREATALRFGLPTSGRTATAAPATIERETIAAWLDRKSQAAFAHARAHLGGEARDRATYVSQLYASLAAEVRAGVYAADSAPAPAASREDRARAMVRGRGGKTAASIAAVEGARAAGFSVAVVSPAGVEVRTPSPSVEFVTGQAPSMPDECRAFLNALHDNTPGDDNGRTLSTACTALERLIRDVYGDPPKGPHGYRS
jgi:hypothetical protein